MRRPVGNKCFVSPRSFAAELTTFASGVNRNTSQFPDDGGEFFQQSIPGSPLNLHVQDFPASAYLCTFCGNFFAYGKTVGYCLSTVRPIWCYALRLDNANLPQQSTPAL